MKFCGYLILEKEELEKDIEKESLGENFRSVVLLKLREENVLRRKWLLIVLNDVEILSKISLRKVY